MAFDPNFIPNSRVDLPQLGDNIAEQAFDEGRPIDHSRFSIVMNKIRGFAIYTAHNIDGADLIEEGRITRRDTFALDPKVPSALQVDDDRGYNGPDNPWDRGHLVRRRSLHWGDEAEARKADQESFFWTNIAPQHKQLHSSAWGKIENWMFKRAGQDRHQACVFTGPVYGLNDLEIVNKPREQPVKLPAGFWKIFVIRLQGSLRAATFLVWQRDFDRMHPVDFDPILEQVRITTVEYLTGLSFATIRDADPLQFDAQRARRNRTERATRPIAISGSNDIIL